ncbi:unnamed protein product, partial [Rotaria sp. Silwood1]
FFFCTYQWSNEQQLSTKHLFYFANIENSIGTYIPNSLRNNESISNNRQPRAIFYEFSYICYN